MTSDALDATSLTNAELDEIESMSDISTDIFESLTATRNAINDVVVKKIQATQKRNKRAYNKCHTGRMELKIGDKVLKEIPKIANKKGKKGKVKWEGPYRVVDIQENGNALIEKMTLPKSMDCVPVHQLKYFKSSGIHVKMRYKSNNDITTLQCIFLDNRSGCHFDVITGV